MIVITIITAATLFLHTSEWELTLLYVFSFVSHWQHLEKKNVMMMMMIIITVVIRMIIPGLMSVSQFVCNHVARNFSISESPKKERALVHTYGWIFHGPDGTCFPFNQTPYDRFGSMNVRRCASPPAPHRRPFPPTSSPSVSLAVFLCSLSMCSAKSVSK